MGRREDTDPDLMTVQEFATKYMVDTSTVRFWIKSGYIKYELVGSRKMRRIRASNSVSPVRPSNGHQA